LIKTLIQKLPNSGYRNFLKKIYHFFRNKKYLKHGQPGTKAETSKAKLRRQNEEFFNKYCLGKGLDIGYGGDPLLPDVDVWDREHGDAQYLNGIIDETYDFVYSSHTIEHMVNPHTTLINWYRVVKKGGYLIIYLPHRDLYEKKKSLPSRFNADHKQFFLIDKDEAPDTIGVITMIGRSLLDHEIIYVKQCDKGFTVTDPLKHSDGEYSIEVVIKKL
jgi:SAM-dependent methyltransferase